MMYTLEEILDERNRQLYNDLEAKAAIILGESDDECWGEKYKDDVLYISCAKTAYPVACFTHELLHGKYDLAGMEMPMFKVEAIGHKAVEALEDKARNLMSYAYNQIMHHKLFPDFVALGFPAGEFLHEADAADGLCQVAKDIATLKARWKREFPYGVPASLIVWPFLYLRSPHDTGTGAQTLLKEIRNMSGTAYYALQGLLTKFLADSSPNVSQYIARLFYLCDLPNVGFGRAKSKLTWARDCTHE